MCKRACVVVAWLLCFAAVSLILTPNAVGQVQPQSGRLTIPKSNQVIPMVGSIIPFRHDGTGCMINSAQIDPCYFAKLNGVNFEVAYRKEGDVLRVTDVRTADNRFVSPEGLKIDDVITISKPEDILPAPYFAVYANRGKVWIPIISGMLDNITVVGTDGKDTIVPLSKLVFDGKEIHVRVSGFVERAGVDYGARQDLNPSSPLHR